MMLFRCIFTICESIFYIQYYSYCLSVYSAWIARCFCLQYRLTLSYCQAPATQLTDDCFCQNSTGKMALPWDLLVNRISMKQYWCWWVLIIAFDSISFPFFSLVVWTLLFLVSVCDILWRWNPFIRLASFWVRLLYGKIGDTDSFFWWSQFFRFIFPGIKLIWKDNKKIKMFSEMIIFPLKDYPRCHHTDALQCCELCTWLCMLRYTENHYASSKCTHFCQTVICNAQLFAWGLVN